MPQIPIDVKEVMNAAADIDAARQVPVRVVVYLDPTAPQDVQDCAIEAFSTTAENALVDYLPFPGRTVDLPTGCDLVVLVAGFSEDTGPLASWVRRLKVPVLTITTLPEIVLGLAEAARKPLLVTDCLYPEIKVNETALPPQADFNQEPYPLSPERIESLRTKIGGWMVDTFKDKRLALALCFDCMRRPLALEFVNATAIQNAGIGAVALIPGADMPVMTANQAKMLLQIAAAYGQKMGPERFKELAGVVGGAFVLRSAARQIVGIVPVGGWAVKGGIGYTGTQAMGRAAIAYFEQITGEKPFTENMADAAEAAKETAVHVTDTFKQARSPKEGVTTVAREYLGTLSGNARRAVKETIPQVKAAVPHVRNTIDSVADTVGIDVQDIVQKAFDAVVQARKGR